MKAIHVAHLVTAALTSSCVIPVPVTTSTQEVDIRPGEPRPAGATVVWVAGQAKGRHIWVFAAEACACTRSLTKTVRNHEHTKLKAVGGSTGTVLDLFFLPITIASAVAVAADEGEEKEWTTEERAGSQQGTCTRAAPGRAVLLRLVLPTDDPGQLGIVDLRGRTDDQGRASIVLPKEAPPTGSALLQVAGAQSVVVRWREGQLRRFDYRPPPPGSSRQGPIWMLPSPQPRRAAKPASRPEATQPASHPADPSKWPWRGQRSEPPVPHVSPAGR
jgi:hypothetical protein